MTTDKSQVDIKTIGQLLTEAIRLHELNPETVEMEIGLPKGYLEKLMKDEFYTNSIPVVLFKNLILSLHIPFKSVQAAMLSTFKLVLSKETPESLKKKPQGYLLWENEESVKMYTNHLKELMQPSKVDIIPDEVIEKEADSYIDKHLAVLWRNDSDWYATHAAIVKIIQAERSKTHDKIREAVANYMRSEGCGCCEDREAHKEHTKVLAELLGVEMYEDKSGYNFGKYVNQ